MNIIYSDNTISVKDYNSLRVSVGWSKPDEASSQQAIERSLYICSAYCSGTIIGSGRVVGDGILAFSIQDVMVIPEYQGHYGVGSKIMSNIINFLREFASPHADIYCFSTQEYEGFYSRFGFIKRKEVNLGAGMILPYYALLNFRK